MAPSQSMSHSLTSIFLLFGIFASLFSSHNSIDKFHGHVGRFKRRAEQERRALVTAREDLHNLTRREDFDGTCAPDRPCPNGACCSTSGFCGYGHDFCGATCISNCDAHAECGIYAEMPARPNPPPLYSPLPDITKPSDPPLDALTHVNYAFTFLDPQTYAVNPMDAGTSSQLLSDTTGLKLLKLDLQIARNPAKRQQFASNVLHFLETYAFDGIDIDWEYPGAPDRGGSPDDIPNFVLLMKTLRATLNTSPRRLGISFTVPASYWYLRWFDVPGLLQYADFTNILFIQAFILSLGFGFYGRSFTLSNPSCNTVGVCPFSGGGAPGPCTGTSGYLAYYEIQDILAKNLGITVHHTQDAAVKYMTWDTNQWIVYDDHKTFKQKVDWANEVGFRAP
ncbi:putative chitinase [Apodospora peruviana]|uniref:chitinase n=1 Tax=Apodospora peruviana TaxID=516989 RepID=A0AAE0IKC1_9PEZI|nr:putative chitinase [Apodospora peruviana]